MPTLEELFKSKQLASQSGKTAEEAYKVQNSKDIRISSSDPLVSTAGMLLARGARKLLGVRGSETFLEQEATGLRIIRAGSIPFIYGSDVARITLKTTDSISLMKTATSGELVSTGAIGGAISSAVSNIKSKLGFPILATPTFVTNELNTNQYNLSNISDRMDDLVKIRDGAGGSLLGKFLKDLGGGNLKTLGRQALGNSIKLVKKFVGKTLFGDGSRAGVEIRGRVLTDNSVTGFTEFSSQWFGRISVNYGGNADGVPSNLIGGFDVDMDNTPYSLTVKKDEDTREERRDLSHKQQLDFQPIRFSQEPERAPKFSEVAKFNRQYSKDEFLETKREMFYGSDRINSKGKFTGETFDLGNSTTLDDKDFAALKFTSIVTNETVQFRATITGLTETFSPSWDSGKFIGSPFSYYTYTGVDRSVSFNFKVFSLNAIEHKIAWDKINFLNSLVYPQGYYDTSAVKPPFIKFTLGDMYKHRDCFIEALSHTFDDTTPWQTSDKETTVASAAAGLITGNSGDIDMKGYRLPMITDVSITIKFLESRSNTGAKKFYTFTPQT